MKALAPMILSNAQAVSRILAESKDKIAELESGSGLDASSAISNTRLLLERLVEFYSDKNNANYFPYHADNELHTPLQALNAALTQFQSAPDTALANQAVISADQLYTAALRYGLVSFGLDANEIKALVEEVGAAKKSVKKIASSIEQKADEIISSATAVASKTQDVLEKITIDAGTVASTLTNVEGHKEAVAATALDVSTAATEAKSNANSAVEAAKAGQAALDSIQQTRANAKSEFDEIASFYGEIEQHQKSMVDVKKDAEAKFNDLNRKYEELQIQYQKQTDAIIGINTGLQAQIKEHLQKAVGVSLFHAFDVRRQGLGWGKWVWASVLLGSVAAGGALSWWLAESLKSVVEVASKVNAGNAVETVIFVKLSAIIPITFGIIFAAKQYANERRAEEEYAFKSAISLSLEPYKDLLQKMKADGYEQQAAFVEKLLMEIFDNPVSRVYSDGDNRKSKFEKAMTLKEIGSIVSVSKDLDVDKVRQLVEILGGNFPAAK